MTGDPLLSQLLDHPKIPTPPGIALQVLERVGRPDCSLAEIREIIRHDPALCGLILKTLNSILYCFSHTVTSIDQALVLLGLSRVRSLVLTLYLPAIRNLARTNPHLKNFWKTSVIGAIIARELAARVGRHDPESDLLAGLMRDMGKVVLIQLHPADYANLLSSSNEFPETYLCDRETQHFGFNHAKVSAALLERWRLPGEIVNAVACHHHPEIADSMGKDVADRAQLLHFASLASQFLISPQIAGLRREMLEQAYNQFRIDETRLAEFLLPLNARVQELGALLNVDVGNDQNYASVLSNVSEQIAQLTIQTSLEGVRDKQSKIKVENEAAHLKQAVHRLKEQTIRDPLTGLYNRPYLHDCLNLELHRHRHRFSVLALMFLDLDGFKTLNDQFGHAFGDQVLKEVSAVMQSSVRSTDMVARFGGDEFCILLPNSTEAGFKIVGERLIRAINRLELRFGRQLCSVGVSIGIAYCIPCTGNASAEQLMEAADQMMYASKHGGKNQLTVRSLLTEKDQEFKESVERRGIRAFLIRRGLLSEQQVLQSQKHRFARVSMSKLARRLGWLNATEARELARLQRTTRKPFSELAVAKGYLKTVDIWTLYAVQVENPESFCEQLLAAGLLGSAEIAEELEAYYLMIGNRGGPIPGSGAHNRPGNPPAKAATPSQAGYHSRTSTTNRFGYHKRGER